MSTFNEITVEPLFTGPAITAYRAYREGDDPEDDPCGFGLTAEEAKQDLIDVERDRYVR